MNYVIIRKEKIDEAKAKYGEDTVSLCFQRSKEKHPAETYSEMLRNEDPEAECFKLLFHELIPD